MSSLYMRSVVAVLVHDSFECLYHIEEDLVVVVAYSGLPPWYWRGERMRI